MSLMKFTAISIGAVNTVKKKLPTPKNRLPKPASILSKSNVNIPVIISTIPPTASLKKPVIFSPNSVINLPRFSKPKILMPYLLNL